MTTMRWLGTKHLLGPLVKTRYLFCWIENCSLCRFVSLRWNKRKWRYFAWPPIQCVTVCYSLNVKHMLLVRHRCCSNFAMNDPSLVAKKRKQNTFAKILLISKYLRYRFLKGLFLTDHNVYFCKILVNYADFRGLPVMLYSNGGIHVGC